MSNDTVTVPHRPRHPRRRQPCHRHVAPGSGAIERRVSRAPLLRPHDRKGRFDRYQGSLDLSARPAVELVIDAESLNTKQSAATSTCARTTSRR